MTISMNPEDEDILDNTPEENQEESKDPLSAEQEQTDPAGDTDTSMEDDKPDRVDLTDQELPTPSFHGHGKDTLEDEFSLSDDQFNVKKEIWGRNKWSFLLIIAVAAVIAIYTLPSMFKDSHDIGIPEPVAEKADYIDVDEEDIPESLTADIPSDEPAIQELPQDMEQQIPVEAVTVQAPPEELTEPAQAVVEKEYYIQVGTWRNPAYAESTLTRLKPYYPDVYIAEKNNFHVIRIPDIGNKQEGNRIIDNIRKRFTLNSLLVLRKK